MPPKEPQKLFSLFAPRPKQQPNLAPTPAPALVPPPPPAQPVPAPPSPPASTLATRNTPIESERSSSPIVGPSRSHNGRGKRRRAVESDSDAEMAEGEPSSKARHAVELSEGVLGAMEVDPLGTKGAEELVKASGGGDDEEMQVELPKLLQLAGASKERKLKQPKLVGSRQRTPVDDNDDDCVIIECSSTGASSSRPRTSTAPTASIFAQRPRKATKSTPIIVISDSPPLQASTSHALPSTSKFLPLSELHRASRGARKAQEPIEVLWPTKDEHGAETVSRTPRGGVIDRAEATERWTSASGKGKARELDGENDFAALTSSFSRYTTSESVPSTSLENIPQLVHHDRTTVRALVPPHPPHPLLDRLSTPFEAPNPAITAFLRPHDRENDTYKVDPKTWRDLWTVKYAPKSAAEVLGETSGRSATLLKAWLEELAISTAADPIPDKKKKRRPVVRETEKPRRKKRKNGGSSDLDDFLASEDDEDDFRAADSDDDDSSSFRLDASSSRRSAFPFLTNLILLCGPTGSGKSSTVHAIANELGWSVFEVFPGIGKRGAKDIERYVGDVGKNHMVRAGTERVSTAEGLQSSSETKDPFANFRKPAATKPASTTTVSQEQPSAESKHATQSVILFDEVDVLYREEKDFWAGLAQFVKTSRRPVIMTCTDLSLIPFDELALQKIVLGPDLSTLYLEFASPAKELAVPFLELVALSEGHIIPREHLLHLYDSDSRPPRHPAWLTHGPADAHPHPNPSSPAPEPDLRRALAQLQFECQWAIGDRMGGIGWMDFTPERDERTAWSAGTYRTVPPPPLARMDQDGEDVLAATVVAAEALSFADAFLARRTATHLEDYETEIKLSATDDEITYFSILDRLAPQARAQLPSLGREADFVQAVESVAQTIRPSCAGVISDDGSAFRDQRSTCVTVASRLTLGKNLLLLPGPTAPNPLIFSDILPFIREITKADDLLAAAEDDEEGGARRGARRSTRLAGNGYVRRIGWSSQEGELVRRSGFPDVGV